MADRPDVKEVALAAVDAALTTWVRALTPTALADELVLASQRFREDTLAGHILREAARRLRGLP